MPSERFDIHRYITDQIIAAIERGASEFRLPWHRTAGISVQPVNVASKKPYRGVNILTLWATADARGYARPAPGTPTGSGLRPVPRFARARKPPPSAAFLCADLRITDEPRADHAQYLATRLSVLKADKKAVFTAASKASEPAAYLDTLQGA